MSKESTLLKDVVFSGGSVFGGGGGGGGVGKSIKQQSVLNLGVSRFGLAVRRQAGKQRDLGSNPLRLFFLFLSYGLWTLSCELCPSQ